jgi:pre-rRNA-processing protein TSR3
MAKFQRAVLVERMDKLPRRAVLLDPFAGTALSPADREIIKTRGIIAVDCSWEGAEEIFRKLNKRRRLEGRTLPMLLAANPVKFGKWGELSTLEALAASYYIMGEKETAREMLSIYTWGVRFLETNREPLDAYAACRDGAEVVKVQSEFF